MSGLPEFCTSASIEWRLPVGVDRASELLSSLDKFPRAAWEEPAEPGPESRSRSRSRAFSLSCCCFFDLNKKAMAGGVRATRWARQGLGGVTGTGEYGGMGWRDYALDGKAGATTTIRSNRLLGARGRSVRPAEAHRGEQLPREGLRDHGGRCWDGDVGSGPRVGRNSRWLGEHLGRPGVALSWRAGGSSTSRFFGRWV